MNQAIEDYLAGLFTTSQLVPAPEVFTGTSSDIRTPESHAILVLADSIENVVGPLHRATVKILVSSPTDNRTQHAALAHAVKSIMEGALPAASGFTVGGFRTKANSTVVTDDDRWLTNAVEWAAKVNGLRARVNAALRVQTRSMEKRLLYFFTNVKGKSGFD